MPTPTPEQIAAAVMRVYRAKAEDWRARRDLAELIWLELGEGRTEAQFYERLRHHLHRPPLSEEEARQMWEWMVGVGSKLL